MNLEQVLSYQKSQLKNNRFLKKSWSKLRGKPVEISEKDKEVFRQHLPLKLEDFFGECILKTRTRLQNDIPDLFENLEYKYLCVLVYFVLTETEPLDDPDGLITLINSASFYLIVNCFPNSENTIFMTEIYSETLRVFDFVKAADYREPPFLMYLDDLRTFLFKSKTTLDQYTSFRTIAALEDFVCFDNTATFETFSVEGMNLYGTNSAYLTFLCYQAIVTHDYPTKLEAARMRLVVVLSLMNCCKSTTAPTRVLSAFQNNVHNFLQEFSPLLIIDDENLITKAIQVVAPNPEYDCYEAMSLLLKVIPIEAYQILVQWVACAMVSSTQGYRRYLPNLAIYIIKNPPDPARFSKCEFVVELLTQNIIKLIADSVETVRENAIRNLEELLKINDAYIKVAVRRIMSREEQFHTLNAKSVLIFLKKNADLKWNKVALNQQIINIVCHFIILRDDYFLTQQSLELLLSMCLSAKPSQLKPCIMNLLVLIEAYLGIADNVAKAVLSVFVHQMNQDGTTSVYTKELWKLIFGDAGTKKNKMETWTVANLLLSSNFDCDNIFQKFSDEDLLNETSSDELVRSVLNYIHEQDTAWKLLSVMCKHVRFTDWFKIEGSITHCLTTQLFPETSVYMFKSLNHMLQNKPVNSDQEMNSLQMMLTLLCNCFLALTLPLNCVSVTLELISTMSTMTHTFPSWAEDALSLLNMRLQRSLRFIVTKNLNSITEIERDLIYTAELVIYSNTNSVSDENLAILRRIVDPELQERSFTEYLSGHCTVWTHCLTLYSKIMFVLGEATSRSASEILQKSLSYTDANVQLPALYALYDLCHIYLEYFDPLIPYLFILIDQKHAAVRLASAKIIMECIEREVVQLKDSQYLLFMSLIIDSDEDVKNAVQKYMRLKFFVKNERCIAQNFVPSILFYNHYYEHPLYKLSPLDITLIQRRRLLHSELLHLFYFLFQNLSRHTQFNIIGQLTKEVLVRALSDLEDYCSRAEKIRVFEDSLLIIIRSALISQAVNTIDTKEFYEEQINVEFKKLLETKPSTEKPLHSNYHGIFTLLLKTLLKLIDRIEKVYASTLEIVFRTVVIFTKGFFDDIRFIVYEDSSLRASIKKFLEFHEKEKDQFRYEQKYVPEEMDFFYAIDL